MKNHTLSLTEGPIVSNILRFALPLFLANLFQQLYNMVDALIVGNYLGNAALAAVSSSGSLIILLVGFFNGIAIGAGVIIARYYGAGQMTELKRAIHTTITFGLLCGLALTLIGLLATPFLLRWMKTPSDILPESILYFRVYFLGSLAFVLYNHFVGILQAVGDSKHPLYYLILSSFLNVCLDFLLIGVFHFGVGAAALATVLS
ncbi:MAG: polysaccharide biosynthesis C-terminal domain-containing protein, partial [Oscillospiraceae bacterium]|nr:polysaccharide biosynthesis C-terminal domain-containing protein [Oscillospiraceae bacterium]